LANDPCGLRAVTANPKMDFGAVSGDALVASRAFQDETSLLGGGKPNVQEKRGEFCSALGEPETVKNATRAVERPPRLLVIRPHHLGKLETRGMGRAIERVQLRANGWPVAVCGWAGPQLRNRRPRIFPPRIVDHDLCDRLTPEVVASFPAHVKDGAGGVEDGREDQQAKRAVALLFAEQFNDLSSDGVA